MPSTAGKLQSDFNMPKPKVPTDVLIKGFKSAAQAQAFLDWYEGGGEQAFYDHLDIIGLDAEDGCNIDVKKGYTDSEGLITAHVH